MIEKIDLINLINGEGIYVYRGVYFRLYKIKPNLGYPTIVNLNQ